MSNKTPVFFRLSFVALLFVIAAAYFSQGCAVAVGSDAPAPSPVEPLASCQLLGQSTDGTSQLFAFDADVANPDPAECEWQGQGAFLCNMNACLVLPYTGSCPHCGGGGE